MDFPPCLTFLRSRGENRGSFCEATLTPGRAVLRRISRMRSRAGRGGCGSTGEAWAAANTKAPSTQTAVPQRMDVKSNPAGARSALAAVKAGEAAFTAGDVALGVSHFRSALELEPRRLDRRLQLARLLAKAGHRTEASAEVDTLVGDPRVDAVGLAQAAALEASLGNPERAAPLFTRAIEAGRSDVPPGWWGGLVNQLDRLAAAAPDLAAFLVNRRETARILRAALARVTPDAAAEARLTYRLVTVLLQLDDL